MEILFLSDYTNIVTFSISVYIYIINLFKDMMYEYIIMETYTDAYDDMELARFFLVLRLHGDDFNTEFLQSVVDAEEPTEKQLVGLSRCVTGLKLKDKISKYDTADFKPFFADEIDWGDATEELHKCYETDESVADHDRLILNVTKKRFISVDVFKKKHLLKPSKKKKLVLSSL